MSGLLKWALGALAAAAVAVLPSAPAAAQAAAQSWPTQRVTIVVPFGAGSVTDILARIFADEMTKKWGQQVIVENRPGLAGTAGVAKAAPDGYTLMVTSNGHTVSGLVTKDAPFDPVKDFAGITRLGSAPLFLIAYPGTPVKTVKDVIELAKKEPGKLNFSSPGLASTTFIAGALFRKAAGINIVHVPFRSAPDAVTAVIRGDAQLYFAPVNLARDQAEAHKVTAIAAATATRMPELPNTPTFTEAGLPYVYDSWFGLLAPHGVPKPILEKISKDWADALKTPDMQAKIKGQFLEGKTDTPDAMDKIIRDETANLTEVFKEAGLGAAQK
jgi:tripartite-type tricarboxylate transporter receptor subunit TctC